MSSTSFLFLVQWSGFIAIANVSSLYSSLRDFFIFLYKIIFKMNSKPVTLKLSPEQSQYYEKIFLIGSLRFSYKNQTKIKEQQAQKYNEFKIKNEVCRIQGSKLVKKTNIFFGTKTISIVDQFQEQSQKNLEYQAQSKKVKKQQIQQDMNNIQNNNQKEKYRVQNSIKKKVNVWTQIRKIFRKYINWLSCFQNLKKQFRIVQKTLKQFPVYNKKLLSHISKIPLIVKPFLKFLHQNELQLLEQASVSLKELTQSGIKMLKRFLNQDKNCASSKSKSIQQKNQESDKLFIQVLRKKKSKSTDTLFTNYSRKNGNL